MMQNADSTAATGRRLASLWLLLAFCLYLPALDVPFFADDEFYLAFSNTLLRELPLASLHQLLVHPANPWEFLPVRDFSYWLDLRLLGDDGFGLHLTNLVMYAGSVCAAAALLREATVQNDVSSRKKRNAGTLVWFAAAFFALHPAHVEAVVWIAGRKDLLAGLFSLAMLALLLHGVRHAFGVRPLLLSWICFVIACFSKSTAVAMALPATAILLQGALRGSSHPFVRRFVVLSAFWMVAILAALIHLHFGAELGIRVENSPGLMAMAERASRILTTLVGLLFSPVNLGLIYDVYALGEWHWVVSALTLAAFVGAFLAMLVGRQQAWPLSIIIMVSPMLPYLQVAPFATWSMASDRFVFVSVAGLALLLFQGVGPASPTRKGFGPLSLLFVVMAFVTWMRVGDWRSEQALYTRDFERIPTHHITARNYLFSVLMPNESGDIPAVIESVAREDVRPFLSLIVDLTIAQRRAKSEGVASQRWPGYCDGVRRLYALHAAGLAQLRREPDMSISNLLRSVDRYLYYSLGNPRRVCDTVQEGQVE